MRCRTCRLALAAVLLLHAARPAATQNGEGDEEDVLVVDEPVAGEAEASSAAPAGGAAPAGAGRAEASPESKKAASDAEALVAEGRKLLKERYVKKAAEKFEQATELAPYAWQPLFMLGIASEKMYEMDHEDMLPLAKAVGAYSQAHNLQPRHPDIVLNRGIALAKLGKADEAIESWQRAAAIAPKDHRPLVNLAVGYQKLEPAQNEEAVVLFRQAVELQPKDAKLHLTLGKALADLERYDEAMLFMQTAGRMSPKRFPSAEEDATKLQWKAVQKQNQIEQEAAEAAAAAAALEAATKRRARAHGRRGKAQQAGEEERGHTAEL